MSVRWRAAWIVGACKGEFVTDGYRWPVALTYASPAYYSQATGKTRRSELAFRQRRRVIAGDVLTLTRQQPSWGNLRMRSEYSVSCQRDGRYVANGFGHLNAAAAELLVDGHEEC